MRSREGDDELTERRGAERPRRQPGELRSARWLQPDDLRSFGHRSRLRQMGYGTEDFQGKPVIAIVNTWSDLTICHTHFRERAEEVKRGVWQAGGFPVEIPAFPLNEIFVKPSPLLYRNLLAMEVEELLRSQPIDGVVLMGGCDKTTPALLMAALSTNLPAIFLPAGPMLRGNWQGKTLGSGSDAWKFWAERCAGNLSMEEWQGIEEGIARSPGHCMTMGTASTMTSLAETLGMTLPGAASIPAVDAAHPRMAAACGRRIVELVWEDWRPRELMTAAAFENAMTVTMAIGGSTNAIIHLLALAGRAKVPMSLARFDEVSRRTPMIANLRPSGQYLMEDFYYAGGLRAMLAELAPLLHLDCWTVNGRTLGENIAGAEVFNREVIRTLAAPIAPEGGTAILYGNLAPNGAVIKSTAASPELMVHTGRAVVFEDYRDLVARIDRDDLAVDATSVLVLRRAGPLGGPGMPEWGMLPIPKKLLKAGVRDMVRVSDARMSGTSYGTCVLHVSPESFVGGPLALVEEGDWIELNVPERRLELRVDEAELSERRSRWVAPATPYPRGYGRLYASHVTQAHEGCDFDFLQAEGEIPDPDIH